MQSTPVLVAEEGRHTVTIEATSPDGVENIGRVEYYGLAGSDPGGYVANLDLLDRSIGWPAVLDRYDQLVLAGHDQLVIGSSDRVAGLEPDQWVLFVSGFGDEAVAAEQYCIDAGLSIPGFCFAGFVQPAS